MLGNELNSCLKNLYSKLLYVGFFSLIINMLMLTVPIYMLQIYDRILTSRSFESLIFLTLIAVFMLVIMTILDGIRFRIMNIIASWFEKKMSASALLKIPDQLLSGEMYSKRAIADIKQIKNFLSSHSFLVLLDMPWAIIFLVIIYFLHPLLGIIATVTGIMLLIVAIFNQEKTKNIINQIGDDTAFSQANLINMLQYSDSIQGMGMLSNIINMYEADNDKTLVKHSYVNNVSSVLVPLSKLIRNFAQIMILGVGAYLVIIDSLTPGMMIAASIIMGRALAPVEYSLSSWKLVVNTRDAYDRLKLFFDHPIVRQEDILLPTPQGHIEVENLYFLSSLDQKVIINNLTFKINPGDNVGIIGLSASGKSTLVKLLVGATKPSNGHIRLDGQDVYQWSREQVNRYIGYLSQNTCLLNGTIAQNIARMGEFDDEAVIKAASITGAHEMILRLPNGYNTIVAGDAKILSEGQVQRIALARAFYGNPKLIVLDEPDANLDQDGIISLIKAIDFANSMKITTVIVSHRQKLFQNFQKLLFIANGQLQMYGPRKDVFEHLNQVESK